MLKDNLKNVEERVQEACDRAGRKREELGLRDKEDSGESI